MSDDLRVALLPCPFCGKEMSVSKSGMATHFGQSQDACIIGTMGIPTDHPASVDKWNTRADAALATIEPAPVSVREAARVWFVAAVAQKGDRCGYRMRRVEADGEEHAIGLAMKVFKELEPDWSFAEPAALRAIAEGKQ